uniref:Ig-like domain-containing protein n=1 Tax=Strigamia maritima TaxID=126957 RepID=T1JIC6_STRMM
MVRLCWFYLNNHVIIDFSRKSVKESRAQVVEEGDIVRFLCQIAAVPPPVFTWQKNKENIPQNSDRFITLKNSGTLFIKEALISDMGNYRCIANNHRRTSEIHLAVKPASKLFISPQIISPKIMVSVKVGEEAVLDCAAKGYPKPATRWSVTTNSKGMRKILQTCKNF